MFFYKIVTTTLVLISACLLNACASYNLQPQYTPHLSTVPTAQASMPFALQIIDARTVAPTMVGIYHTANYANPVPIPLDINCTLQQPLSAFVANSLTAALSQAGYSISDSSPTVLSLTLLNSEVVDENAGFSNKKYHAKLQVAVKILSNRNLGSAWQTTLNADGTYQPQGLSMTLVTTFLAKALDNSIDDLAKQLIASPQFNQAISLKHTD